uniref:Uncharacterized protein n=1 Tax=Schistocephalus solidus TaxID=70667 RepID=A0A0X3NQ33_SCHSO
MTLSEQTKVVSPDFVVDHLLIDSAPPPGFQADVQSLMTSDSLTNHSRSSDGAYGAQWPTTLGSQPVQPHSDRGTPHLPDGFGLTDDDGADLTIAANLHNACVTADDELALAHDSPDSAEAALTHHFRGMSVFDASRANHIWAVGAERRSGGTAGATVAASNADFSPGSGGFVIPKGGGSPGAGVSGSTPIAGAQPHSVDGSHDFNSSTSDVGTSGGTGVPPRMANLAASPTKKPANGISSTSVAEPMSGIDILSIWESRGTANPNRRGWLEDRLFDSNQPQSPLGAPQKSHLVEGNYTPKTVGQNSKTAATATTNGVAWDWNDSLPAPSSWRSIFTANKEPEAFAQPVPASRSSAASSAQDSAAFLTRGVWPPTATSTTANTGGGDASVNQFRNVSFLDVANCYPVTQQVNMSSSSQYATDGAVTAATSVAARTAPADQQQPTSSEELTPGSTGDDNTCVGNTTYPTLVSSKFDTPFSVQLPNSSSGMVSTGGVCVGQVNKDCAEGLYGAVLGEGRKSFVYGMPPPSQPPPTSTAFFSLDAGEMGEKALGPSETTPGFINGPPPGIPPCRNAVPSLLVNATAIGTGDPPAAVAGVTSSSDTVLPPDVASSVCVNYSVPGGTASLPSSTMTLDGCSMQPPPPGSSSMSVQQQQQQLRSDGFMPQLQQPTSAMPSNQVAAAAPTLCSLPPIDAMSMAMAMSMFMPQAAASGAPPMPMGTPNPTWNPLHFNMLMQQLVSGTPSSPSQPALAFSAPPPSTNTGVSTDGLTDPARLAVSALVFLQAQQQLLYAQQQQQQQQANPQQAQTQPQQVAIAQSPHYATQQATFQTQHQAHQQSAAQHPQIQLAPQGQPTASAAAAAAAAAAAFLHPNQLTQQAVMTGDPCAAGPQFITLATGQPLKVMALGPGGQLIQTTGLHQFMSASPMGMTMATQHPAVAIQTAANPQQQKAIQQQPPAQLQRRTPGNQLQQQQQMTSGSQQPTAFFTGVSQNASTATGIPLVQTASGGDELAQATTVGGVTGTATDEKLVYTAL